MRNLRLYFLRRPLADQAADEFTLRIGAVRVAQAFFHHFFYIIVIPYFNFPDQLHQLFCKLFYHAVMYDEPFRGNADLPGIPFPCSAGAGCRLIYIGIRHHDECVVPSQLQRAGRQPLSHDFRDPDSHLGAARHADGIHAGILHQPVSYFGTASRYDLQRIAGHTCLQQQLCDHNICQRIVRGRLYYDRIARRQGGGHLVTVQKHRGVKRNDSNYCSQRLMGHHNHVRGGPPVVPRL